jgi:hypothetical protein
MLRTDPSPQAWHLSGKGASDEHPGLDIERGPLSWRYPVVFQIDRSRQRRTEQSSRRPVARGRPRRFLVYNLTYFEGGYRNEEKIKKLHINKETLRHVIGGAPYTMFACYNSRACTVDYTCACTDPGASCICSEFPQCG